jgi:hypothetical protein
MNPVDHPHGGVSFPDLLQTGSGDILTQHFSRVTINILVRLLPSPDTLPRVKRRVSLLPGELVSCAVPRRPRIKHFSWFWFLGWGSSDCIGLLLCRYGTAGFCERMRFTADTGCEEGNKMIPKTGG